MRTILQKLQRYGWNKSLRFARIEGKAMLYRTLVGSYSQMQEDLVMNRLLRKRTGLYVDIGAGNGVRFSNTLYFYTRGWRGINIEPDPVNFDALVTNRPNDVNLPIGIAPRKGMRELHQFSPSLNSTFSRTVADEFIDDGCTLQHCIRVPVDTLAHVLDRHVKDTPIDILTLDTEGYDYLVLKSNNWKRYTPTLICVESELKHHADGQVTQTEIDELLRSHLYTLAFDNGTNRIYTHRAA